MLPPSSNEKILLTPSLDTVYREALCGEIFLIFGHNISICPFTVVKVVGEVYEPEITLGKLLEREVEKTAVVGLEEYCTVGL